MNEKQLFEFLKHQSAPALLTLLQHAYREMSVAQRRVVFGSIVKGVPSSSVNGNELLKRIKIFHTDSLAGKYYAPFAINSKNFAHIPEETEEWFEVLDDLLADSAKLTVQGDHALAVECFGLLYQLIGRMEKGEELVFADELGSWMIPGEEKKYIAAYLSSLATVTTPEAFTATVLPLIRRDSIQSFSGQVYSVAIRVADKEQGAYLKAEVKQQDVRTRVKR
jgi:hypothetical protein